MQQVLKTVLCVIVDHVARGFVGNDGNITGFNSECTAYWKATRASIVVNYDVRSGEIHTQIILAHLIFAYK